jgi:Uma2 family endonuclease
MAAMQTEDAQDLLSYPKHLPPPGTRMTLAELADLDSDGWRLELVDGRLEVMNPANFTHAIVCSNIMSALFAWVRQGGSGMVLPTDTGTQLAEDLLRGPDVLWVSDQKLKQARVKGSPWFTGAPDLAVEVLSPNDTYRKTMRRVHDQLSHGAAEVWLVDPDERWLEIHRSGKPVMRLSDGDTLDGGELLPGFSPPLAEFFKGLPSEEE